MAERIRMMKETDIMIQTIMKEIGTMIDHQHTAVVSHMTMEIMKIMEIKTTIGTASIMLQILMIIEITITTMIAHVFVMVIIIQLVQAIATTSPIEIYTRIVTMNEVALNWSEKTVLKMQIYEEFYRTSINSRPQSAR